MYVKTHTENKTEDYFILIRPYIIRNLGEFHTACVLIIMFNMQVTF